MEKKKLDFDAFVEALTETDLDQKIVQASLHHSAVSIKDWETYTQNLKKMEQKKQDTL